MKGLASDRTASRAEQFTGWVHPHLPAMANLAARLVGRFDRDDVLQDSLARAWRRWETYRPERGSPRTWLLAIVADQSRRTRRRHLRRPRFPEPTALDPSAGDVDLEAAIRALPRRQRLAVELYYLVDLDISEVAAVMGCSQGTVKSTLFDARTRLRSRLEER
jgi:RNA polymerase sigma-70 factor (ECF subfamily)